VCIDCLLATGTVATDQLADDRLKPHPFAWPEHCAVCATFNPDPRRFDPQTWNGCF
jgi:hypothetical protein